MSAVDLLSPTLRKQMLDFVHCFGVVREQQLRKFFSDWSEGEVQYDLEALLGKGELIRHDEIYLSVVRKLPKPLSFYMPCMDALDVLAMLRSKQIVWLNRDEFPLELTFSTTDNIIYDIVCFDEQWVVKYSMIPRTRGRGLPADELDPITHVAVVPDIEMANKVDPLGFSLYAIIDHKTGHAELFSLDD